MTAGRQREASPAERTSEQALATDDRKRSNRTVLLGVAIEALIAEHARQIGPGAGLVIRAATTRVAARSWARHTDDVRDPVAQLADEFDKARRAIEPAVQSHMTVPE